MKAVWSTVPPTHHWGRNLLFHQQYPTQYGGNVRRRRKPADNVPPSPDGQRAREGTLVLPASGGTGARVEGMVNTRERSLTVVTAYKPKDADRLAPKWHVVGTETGVFSVMDIQHHRRIERTYPLVCLRLNTVSPSRPQSGRDPQGIPTVRRVKDDGKSERRAVIARIGVAGTCPTSLHAKAGRLPSGHPARESLTNRHRRQSR